MVEKFTQACMKCDKEVHLEWDNGLLPGNYVLIADWVYHPECWEPDEQSSSSHKEY